MWRSVELARVITVNRWSKVVGFLLIAVVLVIVVAPDLDLPPTARFSSARHRAPLAALYTVIPAGIALLLPNSVSSLVRVRLAGPSDFSVNLIDLNCTRLC